MLTRRRFLAATPAAFAVALRGAHVVSAADPVSQTTGPKPPQIGFSSRAPEKLEFKPRQITTTSSKVFKILQTTDLHFFHKTTAEDDVTVAEIQKHVERHKPDLVVASGDLWHDNPNGRGNKGRDLVVNTFTKLGVPWTTCWGNHDLLDDWQLGNDTFHEAGHSVFAGALTHGDYRIEVRAPNALADAPPVLDLFFLNSNVDGLGAWQVNALRQMTADVSKRGAAVPAYLFFHIPILEYESKLSATTLKGVKLEGVSRGKENGETFPMIAAPKTIRACFCGHNHTNDYVVRAGDIDLVYGRSTGHAGYGGDKLRKGAKLIEIDLPTGNYQQTSVFADGSKHFA